MSKGIYPKLGRKPIVRPTEGSILTYYYKKCSVYLMTWFIFNTLIFAAIVTYLILLIFEKLKNKWHIIIFLPVFVAFIFTWQYLYNDNAGKRFAHYGFPIKADMNGCYIHATMPPNLAYPDKLELGWYNCEDYDRYIKYFNK
jgi:hypothetical protein